VFNKTNKVASAQYRQFATIRLYTNPHNVMVANSFDLRTELNRVRQTPGGLRRTASIDPPDSPDGLRHSACIDTTKRHLEPNC
jgi:hypothetical protein